jgi:hypothetical protein
VQTLAGPCVPSSCPSPPLTQGEPKIPFNCSLPTAETYLETSSPVCNPEFLMSCQPLRWCEYLSSHEQPLLPSSVQEGDT